MTDKLIGMKVQFIMHKMSYDYQTKDPPLVSFCEFVLQLTCTLLPNQLKRVLVVK